MKRDLRLTARPVQQCINGGEVTGVGTAVVVFEIVDPGIVTSQAPAFPRLPRRVGSTAGAGRGSGNMARSSRRPASRFPGGSPGRNLWDVKQPSATTGYIRGFGQSESACIKGFANNRTLDAQGHELAQHTKILKAGDTA